ncbi:kinase-like domain-containing protein [Phellopilus nigrolimitatus]|nr:kinase-like domain-containing protein [Phellopilus nigrolimitatus]
MPTDVRRLPKRVRHVAKGGFGLVYKTELLADKTVIAVKTPKEEVLDNKKALFREIILWNHLEHQNILPFKGICKFKHVFPSIVSPWMSRGSINDFARGEPLNLTVKYTLLSQVASALAYLHSHDPQIVHEDVRGDNILISDNENALLSDFGISRINSEVFTAVSSKLQHGNTRWLARELIFGLGGKEPKPRREEEISDDDAAYLKATTYSDMWSFGMTFIELLTEKIPFADGVGRLDAAVLMSIHSGTLPERPHVDEHDVLCLPDELWETVRRCWDSVPEKRPSASEMLVQLEKALRVPKVDVRLHELKKATHVSIATSRTDDVSSNSIAGPSRIH